MDLGTSILDFMNRNGVPGAIIIFGGWFLVARLWPFVTEKWWPDTVDKGKRQANILTELTNAVIELKTITAGMAELVTDNRQTLLSMQLAIVRLAREWNLDSNLIALDLKEKEKRNEEPGTLRTDTETDPVSAA